MVRSYICGLGQAIDNSLEGRKLKIGIFASGGGSNAHEVCTYFADHQHIKVEALFCNRKNAGVWKRLKSYALKEIYFSKDDLDDVEWQIRHLKEIDALVLAGFLLKIPETIVKAFEGKIINIHPSLLPKFGGKGMYGKHVHEAVIDAKEEESGISIHLVNDAFDEGQILLQKALKIDSSWDADALAKAILKLEHQNYPSTIEKWLLEM